MLDLKLIFDARMTNTIYIFFGMILSYATILFPGYEVPEAPWGLGYPFWSGVHAAVGFVVGISMSALFKKMRGSEYL